MWGYPVLLLFFSISLNDDVQIFSILWIIWYFCLKTKLYIYINILGKMLNNFLIEPFILKPLELVFFQVRKCAPYVALQDIHFFTPAYGDTIVKLPNALHWKNSKMRLISIIYAPLDFQIPKSSNPKKMCNCALWTSPTPKTITVIRGGYLVLYASLNQFHVTGVVHHCFWVNEFEGSARVPSMQIFRHRCV